MPNPAATFLNSLQVGIKLGRVLKDTFNIESPKEKAKRKEFYALLAKPEKTQLDYVRGFELMGEEGYRMLQESDKNALELQKMRLDVQKNMNQVERDRFNGQLLEAYIKETNPEKRAQLEVALATMGGDAGLKIIQGKVQLQRLAEGRMKDWRNKEQAKMTIMANLKGLDDGPDRVAGFQRELDNLRAAGVSDSEVRQIEADMRADLRDPATGLWASDPILDQQLMSEGGAEGILRAAAEERKRDELDRKIRGDELSARRDENRVLQFIIDSQGISDGDDVKEKARQRLYSNMGLGPQQAPGGDPLNPGGPGAVMDDLMGGQQAQGAAPSAAAVDPMMGGGQQAPSPAMPGAMAPTGPGATAPTTEPPPPGQVNVGQPQLAPGRQRSLLPTRLGGQIEDRRAADIAGQRAADQAGAQDAAITEDTPLLKKFASQPDSATQGEIESLVTQGIRKLNEGGQQALGNRVQAAWSAVKEHWTKSGLADVTAKEMLAAYQRIGGRMAAKVKGGLNGIARFLQSVAEGSPNPTVIENVVRELQRGGAVRGGETPAAQAAPAVEFEGKNYTLKGGRDERETQRIVQFLKKRRSMLKFERDPATGEVVVLRKADSKALKWRDGKGIVLETR